jgi:hypothetical protein
MNWIKEVYTMYDDASKFVFGFHSEASHHDNNLRYPGMSGVNQTDKLIYLHLI